MSMSAWLLPSTQPSSQPTQKELNRKKKDNEKKLQLREEREALLSVILDCVVERKTSADLASR